MKECYLITGASRGLGLALAEALADSADLFLVARNTPPLQGENVQFFQADLTDPAFIEPLISAFKSFAVGRNAKRVNLINNAGVVTPIKPADECETQQSIESITLNLIAPMQLTGAFIAMDDGANFQRRVFNISSGAATSAYAGWSHYCAGKAGLDHYTRCVGVEQEGRAYPALAVSIAPGVVDTNMQSEIRSSNADDFPAIDKFFKLKREGLLLTPAQAAAKLVSFMSRDNLENGGKYDIRDMA